MSGLRALPFSIVLLLVWNAAFADSPVRIENLPTEARQIALATAARCNKSTSGAAVNLDQAIQVYRLGTNTRVAVFDPKLICIAQNDDTCPRDGCEVYIYSEQSAGAWLLVLRQTVLGEIVADKGRGLTPVKFVINLRGGVVPCIGSQRTICTFELAWAGAGFSWKQIR